jgi:hypothetical protein
MHRPPSAVTSVVSVTLTAGLLAVVACSSSSGSAGTAAAISLPTTGPYRACADFDVTSPSTGCICSDEGQGSTVCLPTCMKTSDCPQPPQGGPPVQCIAAQGGLFSYCVMPCTGGADGGTSSACPSGYTCSGQRDIVGPFCAVPGSPISDVTLRYDTTTPAPVAPATPVGTTRPVCSTPTVLSGSLSSSSLSLTRALSTTSGCLASPYSSYPQDVYAIELAGPGPHELTLDSCGHSAFPMALMVFQKPGSTAPYDTKNVCNNLISSADPSGEPGCSGGGDLSRIVGMQPGTVFIVVTTEDPSGESGAYQLTVTSDTSSCP